MHVSENTWRRSEQSVWVTRILFGLVLAKGLVLYQDLLLHPIGEDSGHLLASIALGVVYMTTLLSWLSFSSTMEKSPYFYGLRLERVRFMSDVAVVVLYAYMLFTVKHLQNHPGESVSRYLLAFPMVYCGYFVSGLLRRWPYGAVASRLQLITLYLLLFVALVIWYDVVRAVCVGPAINFAFVVAPGGVVVIYRLHRTRVRNYQRGRREDGLRIGIDVDGVLADQIPGVLEKIKRGFDRELSYEEITEWRLPVGGTTIDNVIREAQKDRRYIKGMRVHEGARGVVRNWVRNNRVYIVTSRRSEIAGWTKDWLIQNRIPFDEYIESQDGGKSGHAVDLLIDDYIGNIADFLTNTQGSAILFRRPWNMDTSGLEQWLDGGRLAIAETWLEVDQAVDRYLKGRRSLC